MTSHQQHQQAKATQHHASARDRKFAAPQDNFLAKSKDSAHSFSGSEPDVSNSTENLSPEERYAVEHTQRQEPQGQENVSGTATTMANTHTTDALMSGASSLSNHRSNDCNSSISSSTNTLIIHNNDDSWHYRWGLGGYSTAGRKSMSGSLLDDQDSGPPQYTSQAHQLNMESLKLNSSLLNSTPHIESSGAKSNILSSTLLNSSLLDSSIPSQKTRVPYLNHSSIPGSPKLSSRMSMNYQTSTDLPDIPSSYLDQSDILKHLLRREGKGSGCSDQSASSSNSGINLISENGNAGMIDMSQMPLYTDLDSSGSYDLLTTLPPPPAYPIWRSKQSEKLERQGEFGNHAGERSSLSKSQPDLTKINNTKDASSPKELLSQRVVSGQTDHPESPMQEVADILAQENNALKMEVDLYHRKIVKLQRFEMEIVKVHEAQQALVKSSERREQLERLARYKLHAEVKRLTELNADLKDQIDVFSTQLANRPLPSDNSDTLRKELNKRDVFIAQLISQNKELIAAKERQEIELTAQKQTLNEQRSHIDILDSALTNSQANVVKLEEELRKKQNIVEQAGQLKRFIVSLQLAADKREQSEKNLRYKLEKEVEALRFGSKQEDPGSKISDLQRELREKEERIMILEGEVTKWEQRYLQESAMRQLAIDAASMPKDSKIAALEKSNHESERSFSQAKADKLRQMEEIHNMSKKQAEYEARNRELESHIAERDAMIRALQRRVEEKEVLYQKALMRTTLSSGKSLEGPGSSNTSVGHSVGHSSQASTAHSHSSSGLGSGGVGCSAPVSLGQDLLSLGSVGRCREQGVERRRMDGSHGGSQFLAAAIHSDTAGPDDLLLDSEDPMLGKLRVVCFPGLVNSSSAAGEGKVSQPLLASVEMRPSLRHPSSDMSRHTLKGPDQPRAVQTNAHDDLALPQYDSVPAYPAELTTMAPLKSEISALNTTQSQNLMSHPSATGGGAPRGAPPPYHGRHEVLPTQAANNALQAQAFYPPQRESPPLISDNSPVDAEREMLPPSTANLSADVPLPRPPMCRSSHHPTVACRKCNSVRSSNRHNAAVLVRRANSSVGHGYRKSAPMSDCQAECDTDDTPSILARLRREWEMGNIPSFENTSANETESPPYSMSKNSAEYKDKRANVTDVKEYSSLQEQQVLSQNMKGKPTQQSDLRNNKSLYDEKNVYPSHPPDMLMTGNLSLQQDPAGSQGNTGQEKILLKLKSLPSSDTPGRASPTTKLNLSSRIQNLFSLPPQGSSCFVQTPDNRSSERDDHNNKVYQENIIKKNDMNHLNNNEENKTELIILEDADQLKTPKDITKPLQDVI
ncbi:Angiomotin [Chionoecetes opilio]|uniref:Angiomotin n=1 Tax=Chionoecetes opilio TaxID=41210 RepID=A0A8J5D2J1_CHIOP|nr:Angiomotin [Chionoecetes opilio]